MKIMRLFLTVIILLFISESANAQKGSLGATLVLNTINHATCFGGTATVNVQLTVTNTISPYVVGAYTMVLNKDGAYYTTLSSGTIQSSASIAIPIAGLPPGSYVISGTANVVNPSNSTSYGMPSFSNLNFFVGYHAFWTETKEMATQAIASSVLQNVTTPTPATSYGGARASNTDAGDYWILTTPFFNSGNAANRSVYVSLTYNSELVSFLPASQSNYLEFRKAGSDPNTGDGVYYKSTAGIVKLVGVTYTDKIRVVKTGTNLLFYKDQSLTALASSSVNPYTVALNAPVYLTAFTTASNDGVNIATSLKCNYLSDAFATLFEEVDGAYYTMKSGKLKFVFNHNYDTQSGLKFNIYNSYGMLQKTNFHFPAVAVTYGDNYITLDLTTGPTCLGEGIFVLEVISDKKEKTYLRFYNEYKSCTPEADPLPGGVIVGG